MSETKALPCPFCGSSASLVDATEGMYFHVECDGCAVEGQYLRTRDEAIAAWNHRAALPEPGAGATPIRRFTMFRKGDLSATHNAQQANAPDEPQFEGVVFSDGTVALRWLTACRSTSVWADLDTMLAVHGHPEERYQSAIVWHDHELPATGGASRPEEPKAQTTGLLNAARNTWGPYNVTGFIIHWRDEHYPVSRPPDVSGEVKDV